RETKDPAFGLDAWWIEPGTKDHAQTLGYTVVDASTVIATHLSQILQNNAQQLLGHEEVQQLLDVLAHNTPKLVVNLVPDVVPLAVVVKVLQNLLSEGVPVRDTRTIAETLAECAPKSQDPGVLTAAVRSALGRLIVQHINGMAAELPVITLDSSLEQLLHQSMRSDSGDGFAFEPGMAERFLRSLQEIVQQQEVKGEAAVLLVSPALRPGLANWIRHSIARLHVLSYQEVPESRQIKIIATVGDERNGRLG
ncbi:MAG: FHIPEP family type III secretion protein, partial [Gammaproteobacteria bacterium]|nr:FHIPEP family type III secretion protein [Gammaproteobacteria bacterium]